MKSDFQKTGKTYKKLDAYINGKYFASSIQFKTCKSYKAFLQANYPQDIIQVNLAKFLL